MSPRTPSSPGPAASLDPAATQEVLVTEFRRVLLLRDDEPLDVTANYFDLGMSSLRLLDVKETAERRLGTPLDTALFFTALTVQGLAAQLSAPDPPADLAERSPALAGPDAERHDLVDSVLDELLSPPDDEAPRRVQ